MNKNALFALFVVSLFGFTNKENRTFTKIAPSSTIANKLKIASATFQVTGSRYVLPGTEFLPGSTVCESTNGQYKLEYQTDGNLVLYKSGGIPLWASGPLVTNATKIRFESGGNVRAINNVTNTYWQSNTGYTGPLPMIGDIYWALQDDGNFVRYWGTPGNPNLSAQSISTRTSGGVNSPNYGSFQP